MWYSIIQIEMSGAKQTIRELDSMEEKLRRLGLGSDAAVDPLKGKGKEFTETYIEKIRTEQRDRRRVRREKEYRRYISSDQYLKEGDLGAEGKVVQAVVDNARDALLAEKRRTEELIRRTDQKEIENYSRAAQFDKVMSLERNNFEVVKNAQSAEGVGLPRLDVELTPSGAAIVPPLFAYPKVMTTGTSSSGLGGLLLPSNPPRNLKKHQMAVELCRDVVKGLIELTFLVSDNRFLLAEELTGKPVKSLDQDLKVSEWRDWVQLCLYKKPLGSLRSQPGGGVGPVGGVLASSNATADSGLQKSNRPNTAFNTCGSEGVPSVSSSAAVLDGSNDSEPFATLKVRNFMAVEEEMASELVSLAVGLEEFLEAKRQNEAVGGAIGFLQGEGRRLRRIALDNIRRFGEEGEEEASTSVTRSVEAGDARGRSTASVIHVIDPPAPSLLAPLSREEILPGWTHRMPFACCIVHGDELSGVRLLMEAVERQVRHAWMAAMYGKGAPGGIGAGGPGMGGMEGAGNEIQFSTSAVSVLSVSSGATGKPHDKVGSVAQHNQEKVIGATRVQDGIKKTYITPRTLLGRAQPVVNKEGASKGASRHTGGGGKGAPHHRPPVEDDERKDFEAMTETLSREIVKAHFHNLHILGGGKVPAIQLGAVTPAPVDHSNNRRSKSSGTGGGGTGGNASKKMEEQKHAPPAAEKTMDDESLYCLFLIGFPETELFYQMLEARIGSAIDAAEMALVVEQQRLDEQAAAQLASTLSGNRGRSHSITLGPKSKQSSSSAVPGGGPSPGGKGSKGASKNAAVEDVSSLIAQLHAKKVFPPLCILGYFLEYDIPARQRRLKEAYFLWSSSQAGAAGSSGTTGASGPSSGSILSNTLSSGVRGGNMPPALSGVSLSPVSIPYLFHPVYNPESSSLSSPLFPLFNNNLTNPNASLWFASTVGSCSFMSPPGAPTSMNRDSIATRSSTEKNMLFNNTSLRNDSVGASMVGLNLSSAGSAAGVGTAARKRIAAADWDIATVHRELMQRHSKMKNWKSQWQASISTSAMISFRRLASGPPAQSPKEKSKKRGPKPSGGASSIPPSSSPTTSPPTGTASSMKEGFQANAHGNAVTSASVSNVDIYSADSSAIAGHKEMFTFPKVLYFCRTDCVNDFASEMGSTEEVTISEGPREDPSGACFPFFSSPFFFMGSGKPNDSERNHIVEVLLRKINETTRTQIHPITQSQLVPNILPDPLRLSDYRLPNELCQDLVHRYNLYEQKLFLQKNISSPFPTPPGANGALGVGGGLSSSSTAVLAGTNAMPFPGGSSHCGLPEGAHQLAPSVGSEGGEGREEKSIINLTTYGLVLPNLAYLEGLNTQNDNRSMQQRQLKKDILQLEMSVYQSFSMHLNELLCILSGEAFPDSIWCDGRQQARNFSHTVHYVSIDKNAAELKERMQWINGVCTEELLWRCALLLRYVVDSSLEATATAMRHVYAWIQRLFFNVDASSIGALPTQPIVYPPSSGLSSTNAAASLSTTQRGTNTAGVSTHRRTSAHPHPSTTSVIPDGMATPPAPSTAALSSAPQEQGGKSLDFPDGTTSLPAQEENNGTSLSLPSAPSVPRSRRICDDEFRLSKEDALQFISFLCQDEEKGVKRFWETFSSRVLAPVQQKLEEEFRDHIEYFIQLQEYQRQALIIQAKRAAQEKANNAAPLVSSPTIDPKKNSPGGSPARRNSRKGGSRHETRVSPPKKGSGSARSTGSQNGALPSERGASPAATGVPGSLGAERAKVFPWAEKHTDPVSELQWDAYVPSMVVLALSQEMASPTLFSWDDKNDAIESSKGTSGVPSALSSRGNNATISQPLITLHGTAESRESLYPSSLDMSWNVSEGDGVATMLLAAGPGGRMGGVTLPISFHSSRNFFPNTCSGEGHPGLRVSASLGRTLVMIKEVLCCTDSAKRSAQLWLEVMYQTALATPTNGAYPEHVRPKTISQLFSAPPAPPPSGPHVNLEPSSIPFSHLSHPCDSAPTASCSFCLNGGSSDSFGWPRLNLELLLSYFSIYGKQELTLEEFLHCSLLTQLSQTWRYMNVNLKELASNVGYTRDGPGFMVNGGASLEHPPPLALDTQKQQTDRSVRLGMIPMSARSNLSSSRSRMGRNAENKRFGSGEGLLDVLNTKDLLHAPCREEQHRQLPFLSVGELITFFHRNALPIHGPPQGKDDGKVSHLNIRWWLFKMLCRRCCFCQSHRCEFLRGVAVPLPSQRELRRAVSLLPECVLRASFSPIPLLPPYFSRRMQDGPPLVKDQGVPLEWWSCEGPREKNERENEDIGVEKNGCCPSTHAFVCKRNNDAVFCFGAYASTTIKRAITRIATSTFCLSKYGVLRQEYPSLPLVLYLLAHHPDSIEDSISRMFHCFAALMMKSSEPDCFFEAGGAESLAASRVQLTVEEFVCFFSWILQSTPSSSSSSVVPPSSSFGGVSQSHGAQTSSAPSCSVGAATSLPQETLPLDVDAQLLLQVEEKERISQAMLLSSHWGRALVASHLSPRHA